MNYIDRAIEIADQYENGDIATWDGFAASVAPITVHEVVEALQNRNLRVRG